MDADEKLMALKKAYADIIFNISKEAAARVMSSEKKAALYQHELKVSKEEGVRMLLRLKKIMEFKISEAEAASLNQQKKAEELEAQLNEAEDIVRDLRGELREVQAELDRVKNDNFQQENEPEKFYPKDLQVENGTLSYQLSSFLPPKSGDVFSVASEVSLLYPSLRNECHKCYKTGVCTCGVYTRNRELPSIILRGKEPGLYRNGRTQRIRACERKLSDREVCNSSRTDRMKDKKTVMKLGEGKGTRCRKVPDSGEKSLGKPQKKLVTGTKTSGFKSVIQKKKRTSRQRKVIAPLTTKHPLLSPELSMRTCPISVEDSSLFRENSSSATQSISAYTGEPQKQPEHDESCERETGFVEVFGVKSMKKHEETIEDMVPVTEETGFPESSLTPKYEIIGESETMKIPLSKVEKTSSDTAQELASTSTKERIIKYTFQRKRKRHTLSNSDVNGSLEIEKETGDNPNSDQEERPISSLLTESSRESRRLAQVARQLISLSEKKWWQ